MGEFGQLLRQLREAQGQSIDSVSQATRIPSRHLIALEAEQFQSVPSDASARGFVRLLAKHYRKDAQELLRFYERSSVDPHGGRAPMTPLAQTNTTIFKVQSGRRHAGLGMGVGLIVMVLLMFGWMRGMQEPVGQVQVAHSAAKVEKAPAPRPTSPPTTLPTTLKDKPRSTEEQKVMAAAPPSIQPSAPLKSEPAVTPAVTLPDSTPKEPALPPLRLEIEAHEQSWVQATLDGGEMKEALLQTGERLTWTATEQMELTIGNAGGLALSFNGQSLATLGEPGQVVRLHLTKDGLEHVRRYAPPRPPQPPPSTLSTPAPPAPSTFAF
jgi:cytoskeleton protein RodZ